MARRKWYPGYSLFSWIVSRLYFIVHDILLLIDGSYLMLYPMIRIGLLISYNGLSNYGYGFLDRIPIIYILKYLTPDKFESNV